MTESTDSALPPGADDDFRDLAGGGIVLFVGKLGRVSRGAFIWIITLLCGMDVQGLYSVAWSIASTLNKVARFGVGRGVVRFVAAARAENPETDEDVDRVLAAALTIVLAMSGAVTLTVVLAADSLAAWYDKPIAPALRVMAWTAPFISVTWVFCGATRALRIMRYEVYVLSIGGPLILFVGGLGIGLAGLGLLAIAQVQLAMGIGNCLLAAYYFQRHFSLAGMLHQVGRRKPWKELTRFCFPVMVTDLLYATLTQLDILMLGWFVSAHQVGLYALVRRVSSAMLKAPQAFDPIFSSVVSDLSLQDRHDELAHRFVVISRWILTINLPIFACLLIVGDTLMPVLGGHDVETVAELQAALGILVFLCVGMMVQGTFAMVEPLLTMSGRPYLGLLNNSLWLAVNLGLNMWLIPIYGIVGAAMGAAASMLLVSTLRVLEVIVLRGIMPFGPSQLKPLAAAAVATVPALLVVDFLPAALWRMLAPAVAFVLVYGTCLTLMRFEAEDRILLRRLQRRVLRSIRPDDDDTI